MWNEGIKNAPKTLNQCIAGNHKVTAAMFVVPQPELPTLVKQRPTHSCIPSPEVARRYMAVPSNCTQEDIAREEKDRSLHWLIKLHHYHDENPELPTVCMNGGKYLHSARSIWKPTCRSEKTMVRAGQFLHKVSVCDFPALWGSGRHSHVSPLCLQICVVWAWGQTNRAAPHPHSPQWPLLHFLRIKMQTFKTPIIFKIIFVLQLL